MKRFGLALLGLLVLGWTAGAQTSREELLSHMELTAGNYANYPLPTGHLTPAPAGYEPFYISHYGRHGSRYMTSNKYYVQAITPMDSAGWLRQTGLIPGSTPMYLQKKAVRDSIESIADRVIREGKPALTLRFSHDSSVLPLAYLIGLKETLGGKPDTKNLYKSISIDKIVPMAGNIQLVFYRKPGSDDILVKFLLNENETSIPIKTDCAPYYHWSDVKRFWEGHPAITQ